MLRKIIAGIGRISAKHSGVYALYLGNTTISLAQIADSKVTLLRQTEYSGGEWQQAVRHMLSVVASNSSLHLVLSPDFYQLVQLDKPALSESEMLQALPWQVKDLVSIAPEDIVADYIDLPGYNTSQSKINVVVASQTWLKQLVQTIQSAGQQLLTIQPEEWLASQLITSSTQATMLVIHQPDQEVLIQIIRDNLLYFSRRTRGLSRLHLSSAAELQGGELDRLQLELQRSMDYFESQLKQPPVRDIRLLMDQAETVKDVLNRSGFSRVDVLHPNNVATGVQPQQLIHGWPAVAVLSSAVSEPAR